MWNLRSRKESAEGERRVGGGRVCSDSMKIRISKVLECSSPPCAVVLRWSASDRVSVSVCVRGRFEPCWMGRVLERGWIQNPNFDICVCK